MSHPLTVTEQQPLTWLMKKLSPTTVTNQRIKYKKGDQEQDIVATLVKSPSNYKAKIIQRLDQFKGIRMANLARRTYTLFGVVGLPYLTVNKLTPMTLGNFTEKDSEEFISRLRT
nr:4600_t:CDS:2 [Entrophospora candida]